MWQQPEKAFSGESIGQKVVEIVDGHLVETHPDGSTRILKKAPPKHKVSVGMKLKVT